MANTRPPLPRGSSHRPAIDELRLGVGLAQVFLTASHIVDPPQDAAYHKAVVPADMSDRGVAPDEGGVGVGAD